MVFPLQDGPGLCGEHLTPCRETCRWHGERIASLYAPREFMPAVRSRVDRTAERGAQRLQGADNFRLTFVTYYYPI